jgi:hypothetical protein
VYRVKPALCRGPLAARISPCECRVDGDLAWGVIAVAQEGDLEQSTVPLPGDLKPISGLPTADEATLSIAPRTLVSLQARPGSRSRAGGADWFVWSLALASIMVPIIVLVCVGSIPRDTLAWHEVSVSVDRGDFLIPAMALCVETV